MVMGCVSMFFLWIAEPSSDTFSLRHFVCPGSHFRFASDGWSSLIKARFRGERRKLNCRTVGAWSVRAERMKNQKSQSQSENCAGYTDNGDRKESARRTGAVQKLAQVRERVPDTWTFCGRFEKVGMRNGASNFSILERQFYDLRLTLAGFGS